MKIAFTFDDRVNDLNKEATAAKRAGDWKKAIRLLREVKELQGEHYADTRLAKFMQESGDFEAAMEEIDELISNSFAWSEASFGHQPRSVRRRNQASFISRVHKDAALICRREKNTKLQVFHEREYERWLTQKKTLNVTAGSDKKAEQKAWEDAKKKGAKAMSEFMALKRARK